MAKDFELSNHQIDLIQNGFVAELGSTNFTVLLVIKALTANGEVVTQNEIANISGLSRPTVNRAIGTLVSMGLLAKTVTAPKGKKQTVYTEGSMNTKDFIYKFCQLYEDTYHVKYLVNWKTEGARVKKCLIGKFTDEELNAMLETVFKLYSVKWATKDYPAPTIGMICSWLGNKALNIVKEEWKTREKQKKDLEELKKEQARQDAAWQRMMERLERGEKL